ncbi:hypothetical protein DFH08DRAFT_1088016 [Mycena albidolilacea]|uniref:Uncharacterized protein n=1 Tax=Mycena albidolilacea TaxID=1033008 RepID=A0AAD7EC60_9AGAR|nr:hypothetical protein DFH08DRAFT_1088016 [Mycena albidolilacea]
MPAERQDELGLGHVGRAEGFCQCSRFAGGCSVSSSSDSPLSTASVESLIAGVIVYSAEKVKHGAAASVLVRARARLNPVSHIKTLRCCAFTKEVIYRTWPPPLAPHRDIDVSTRFGVARTRTCPGPSPLRAANLAPKSSSSTLRSASACRNPCPSTRRAQTSPSILLPASAPGQTSSSSKNIASSTCASPRCARSATTSAAASALLTPSSPSPTAPTAR